MAETYVVLSALFGVFMVLYVVSRFVHLEKYGLEVTPIYLLYKTERFNGFLSRIAEKNQRLWKAIANIGIALAIAEMALAIYFLANNLQNFLYAPREAGPVVPILPGITISFQWFPYVLIAIGLAITIHEAAHGILAFSENIPVKSSGLILAPITFGGFVEPDEEVFNKSPLIPKLRVLAVGSLTNMAVGLLTLLLLLGLFVPFSGVLVTAVPENSPAYAAGVRPWEVILSINGHSIRGVEELRLFMVAIRPGATLSVETSRGVRSITTAASPVNRTQAILGVQGLFTYSLMRVGEVNPWLSHNLYMTLYWVSLLMTNVAVFNMLPLFPFDGEAYVYQLLKARVKKGLTASRIAINLLSLFLLVSNVGLSLIRYGLAPLY